MKVWYGPMKRSLVLASEFSLKVSRSGSRHHWTLEMALCHRWVQVQSVRNSVVCEVELIYSAFYYSGGIDLI